MRIASFLIFIAFATSAMAAAFEYDGVELGTSIKNLPKGQYRCAPAFLPDDTRCHKENPGKVFGVRARQVELSFKNERCRAIFVNFSARDALKVAKGLERKYGKPRQAGRLMRGVYQVKWRQGAMELLLTRDDKRGTASISITGN